MPDLLVGVVVTADGAHYGRFVGEIALGDVFFGGAIGAVAGTGERFGEDGNRGDAGAGADGAFF